MKAFVRVASLLLALLLLAGGMVSCAKTETAPEGMKAANIAGDDFRLYVPMTWTLNTDFGTAGAYANMEQRSSVSAVKYPLDDAMQAEMLAAGRTDAAGRMEWFWEEQCIPSVRSMALGGEVVMDEALPRDTVLSGLNAKQFGYRATLSGSACRVLQVVLERQKKLSESATEISYYVLTFIALDELYDSLSDARSDILDQFVLSETPYAAEKVIQPPKEGVEAPEGMKIASNDDVAYRLFVPNEWTVTIEDGITSAYVPTDRANVSVVPYLPSVTTEYSVPMYFTESETRIKQQFGEDYTYLSHEDATLGGRKAHKYRFSIVIDGQTYQYCQVIGAYKSMIYCVTYTATDASFALHSEAFDAIVGAFAFR